VVKHVLKLRHMRGHDRGCHNCDSWDHR
jgi:hypothetical protein